MDKQHYFVSGIGTEVGKTIVSAILVEALQADYWKPIQSGDLLNSDSMKISKFISNKKTNIHPERYRLNIPASPHYSAEQDNVQIKIEDFTIPKTSNKLIIEGAGGLFVPINDKETILDIIQHLNVPIILVASYYLGSINHTLLSLEAIRFKNLKLTALVFNGTPNIASRDVILKMHPWIPTVIEIPEISPMTKATVQQTALDLNLQTTFQ